MTKDDREKAILIGVVGGITAAITALTLLFGYIEITERYNEYQQEQYVMKMESTPPDNRSGDFCPMCGSTDVCRYLYGLLYRDSVIIEKERNHEIKLGGCTLSPTNPRYKCNWCSYKWGNYVDLVNRLKAKEDAKKKIDEKI